MENDMAEKQNNKQDDAFVDLANRVGRSTIAVVDTMVQRGALRGEELSTIGQLRDQCVQIVAMCEAKQEES
jgi:hypothetical protein